MKRSRILQLTKYLTKINLRNLIAISTSNHHFLGYHPMDYKPLQIQMSKNFKNFNSKSDSLRKFSINYIDHTQ